MPQAITICGSLFIFSLLHLSGLSEVRRNGVRINELLLSEETLGEMCFLLL
jgi:hypothetical protein